MWNYKKIDFLPTHNFRIQSAATGFISRYNADQETDTDVSVIILC